MTNVRMKYSELLDRFVKLRVFTDAEREKIFRGARPADGESYRELVVHTTVVGYADELQRSLRSAFEQGRLRPADVKKELYELAVAVNPELDIKKVTFDVSGDESATPLYLLGGDQSQADGSTGLDLFGLDNRLAARVIGQPEAVEVVAAAVRRAFAGLRDERRPIGNFLFIGQTGVGKTELAKALSAALMGDDSLPVRIDCSEYSQPHEYAKLIGAPPGYIGHTDGGMLTEAVKARPRSVVLFDEIEKAHSKVHNLLLQLMDEGILTDSAGAHVTFGDCLIILTSNVGAGEVEALGHRPGFRSGNDSEDDAHTTRAGAVRKALQSTFKPEFLNRIDETVFFRRLGAAEIHAILELHLARVVERLEHLGVGITFSAEALGFLAERGTDARYGARPLLRAIKTWVETPLADRLLAGTVHARQHVVVAAPPGTPELSFRVDGENS